MKKYYFASSRISLKNLGAILVVLQVVQHSVESMEALEKRISQFAVKMGYSEPDEVVVYIKAEVSANTT